MAPTSPEASGSSLQLPEILTSFASDLIALQEVDHRLERSAKRNQIEEIADSIGAQWWAFAPTIAGTPGQSWRKLISRERVLITSKNEAPYYGIAMASKVPVTKWLRLELGRSWIGAPLLVPTPKGRVIPIYVKDEPRVAMAAVLENGWTVINTHLSFVPLVNIYQLFKVTRWAVKIERDFGTKVILLGDFNLAWSIPSRLTSFKRATQSHSYPAAKPAIAFDYILTKSENLSELSEFTHPAISISDHRPLSVDIND